jgi:hypothetical protein
VLDFGERAPTLVSDLVPRWRAENGPQIFAWFVPCHAPPSHRRNAELCRLLELAGGTRTAVGRQQTASESLGFAPVGFDVVDAGEELVGA